MKEVILGNAAIAKGAIAAGVKFVAGYPGTPSTEVLQTVADCNKDGRIYVEWSTNEKAAVEAAAGAAYSGARALVTMKQVGLNVASDPVMCLSYIGIKGGMVILVADDPGPISSQTEQDTRHFGEYANIPVLDPSSPEETYDMAKYAFELSEKIGMPVILRPTTKVCHASGTVEVDDNIYEYTQEGFVKDPRWVIFPPLSYRRHIEIEAQQSEISKEFDEIKYNSIVGNGRLGIAAGGVTYAILLDVISAMGISDKVTLLKSGAVFPPPVGLYGKFIRSVDKILVLEELDPVIETQLYDIMGRENIHCEIIGKCNGFVCPAGELKFESIAKYVSEFTGVKYKSEKAEPISLPVRPPVLCAGCPHRASFYAVKKAMKGKKAVFCGDIGCYTLGNAKPLDMTDTCLCMGAGVTIAQGIARMDQETTVFAFIGDSTFFASGMTGLANAVYNKSNVNIIILDNSTTAMTGHQPHPGIGKTMMHTDSPKIDPAAIARAMNVGFVEEVDPYDLETAVSTVKKAAEHDGVSVIIFKAPCIALTKPEKAVTIDGCIGCMHCINEIGCPAMYIEDGKVKINDTLCFGCGLCKQLCPTKRIK